MFTFKGKDVDIMMLGINGAKQLAQEAVTLIILGDHAALEGRDKAEFIDENLEVLARMCLAAHQQWLDDCPVVH